MKSPIISLVVAASENGVIGKDGRLPWRIKDDMQRFKRLTMGHPCIMGRKTWDSIPKRPLPGRTNIVVTRNPALEAEGARTARSFEEALAIAREENPSEIMVIGGEAIYEAALPHADRIYLTRVFGEYEGDALFTVPKGDEWREISREGPFEEQGVRYTYVLLERG